MSFSAEVITRFERPSNVGSFGKDDASVGIGLVGAPERGEVIRLEIKVAASGVIAAARFKAFGGPETIASASLACDWLEGKTIDEGVKISGADLGDGLQLDSLQMRSAALAADAIRMSIDDYCKRNPDELTRSRICPA